MFRKAITDKRVLPKRTPKRRKHATSVSMAEEVETASARGKVSQGKAVSSKRGIKRANNGIMYVVKTGCSWRSMPTTCPLTGPIVYGYSIGGRKAVCGK